ncbi:MAG: hypothetical protein M9908_12770 [Phyllobacteriaceae bacterium]|nr:hypothetical protein [Phyllobacteriaceae bacterium]
MTAGGRKTAVVVCPGRGTYNKGELGYLARHFTDKARYCQPSTKDGRMPVRKPFRRWMALTPSPSPGTRAATMPRR